MFIGNALNERDTKTESCGKGAVVFAQAFDDPGVLLRHNGHRLGHDDENQGGDQKQDHQAGVEENFHGALLG